MATIKVSPAVHRAERRNSQKDNQWEYRKMKPGPTKDFLGSLIRLEEIRINLIQQVLDDLWMSPV